MIRKLMFVTLEKTLRTLGHLEYLDWADFSIKITDNTFEKKKCGRNPSVPDTFRILS